MNKKILISDPSQTQGQTTTDILTANQYQTDSAVNGKDAQVKLFKEYYNAIVLDIDTIDYSAMEVLKYIKTKQLNSRVIITIDSKDRLNELELTDQDLEKLGANSILIKPFNATRLIAAINGELEIKNDSLRSKNPTFPDELDKERIIRDDLFTRIPIREFYSTTPTLFDIYIRINPHRYIKIIRKGDAFSPERVKKYHAEKKLEFLFFKTRDRATYINHLNKIMKRIIEHPNKNLKQKVGAIQIHGQLLLEEFFTDGIKPQLVEQGKQICKNLDAIIKEDKNLSQLIRSLENTDPSIHAHSFLVAFLSAVCCIQMGWDSPQSIEKITMGAMLHDIGKMQIPEQLLEIPSSMLTDEQFKQISKHPQLGVNIVDEVKNINNEVKHIILQHHETADGQGYPNHLTGIKIYPLAQIVGFVDFLSHIMSEQHTNPLTAFKFFLKFKNHLTKYDPKIVRGFANCLIQK